MRQKDSKRAGQGGIRRGSGRRMIALGWKEKKGPGRVDLPGTMRCTAAALVSLWIHWSLYKMVQPGETMACEANNATATRYSNLEPRGTYLYTERNRSNIIK